MYCLYSTSLALAQHMRRLLCHTLQMVICALSVQVPAVFDGLTSYKNGMKGAIGTQLGLVRFKRMVLADNGGGPRQHVVNGKDNGAAAEITWVGGAAW